MLAGAIAEIDEMLAMDDGEASGDDGEYLDLAERSVA